MQREALALENVLALAATLAGDGPIEPGHLELPAAGESPRGSYHQQIEAERRRLIGQAWAKFPGHLNAGAHWLGISRQADSYHLRQLGLTGNGRR